MIPILKIVFASILILAGAVAAGSMLLLTGRPIPAKNPVLLRRIHAWAGRTFAACLFLNTLLGAMLLSRAGDALPLRAVLHWHLALVLGALVLAKIGIVKIFRPMLRWAPPLGLFIAGTAFVVVLASLGFEVLGGSRAGGRREGSPSIPAVGPAETGREIFSGLCAGCHGSDGAGTRGGPALAGLFRSATLPVSGRPATEENVRLQLRKPFRSMPPFAALREAETAALVAYLRRL
ncbi:MAG: cytochrome c [Candidatus Aminicenantes bacterium]|nr:cytochrome c [Candidatus Aminicenantes bacterium]